MFVYRGCDQLPKKTLEVALETGNHLLVQVKANQGYLLFDCKQGAKEKEDDLFIESSKRKRNRKEKRTVRTFHGPDFIYKEKWNPLIKMVVQVHREVQSLDTKTKTWKASEEVAYYICSQILPAGQAAQAIREHWGIENRNHYVRDTAMNEDHSRIRKNPQIMAKLRSIALNIMRATKCTNIKSQLYSNTLDLSQTLKRYGHLLQIGRAHV